MRASLVLLIVLVCALRAAWDPPERDSAAAAALAERRMWLAHPPLTPAERRRALAPLGPLLVAMVHLW